MLQKKRSESSIILNSTNELVSITIMHSTELKEEYRILKFVLETIKYSEQSNWLICGDLKILTILLGKQGGYTKHTFSMFVGQSRSLKLLKKNIAI